MIGADVDMSVSFPPASAVSRRGRRIALPVRRALVQFAAQFTASLHVDGLVDGLGHQMSFGFDRETYGGDARSASLTFG
jgi:hypothetical protein